MTSFHQVFTVLSQLSQVTQIDISPCQNPVKTVDYIPLLSKLCKDIPVMVSNDGVTESWNDSPPSFNKTLLQILKLHNLGFFRKQILEDLMSDFIDDGEIPPSGHRCTSSFLGDVPHMRKSSTEPELGERLWHQTFWIWTGVHPSRSYTIAITFLGVWGWDTKMKQRLINRRITWVNVNRSTSDSA